MLGAYADDRLSRRQAIDALDLRDSAELLVAPLGNAGLDAAAIGSPQAGKDLQGSFSKIGQPGERRTFLPITMTN